LLASESKTPGVVDRVAGGPDILASFTDVIDSAVMIFAAALEGDACVFQSALDDLATVLPAWRRCGAGNHLLGLGGLPISGAWGATPRRRIWVSRALGSSLGRVFIGDGDEFGDSSAPPLTPVISGYIDLFVLSILSGRTSKTEFVCKSYGQLKFAVENHQKQTKLSNSD
jgi:hypothetical protein